jgi:hypothetical protein
MSTPARVIVGLRGLSAVFSRSSRFGATLLTVPILTCLAACHRPASPTCYPAYGAEAWIERHYSAASANDTLATVEVRLVPDSSNTTGPQQSGLLRVQDLRSSPSAPGRSDVIDATRPVAHRLGAGTYRLTVRVFTWESVVRDVTLTPGERVTVDVRMRRASYCLEGIVVVSRRDG